MITDITIGRYFPVKSFVHNLDARTKLLLTLALLVFSIIICKNGWSLLLLSAFSVVCYSLSKLKWKLVLKSIKPLIPIILLTSVLQLYFIKEGSVLVSVGKFSITDTAVYTALFVAVRVIILLVISSLLTYTTSPTDLTDGVERLLSPLKVFKVDVQTFGTMTTIALRFIPTLIDEIDRIMSAQKARGADFENGGLVKRIKALFPIFIPLFVSALKHAYELADAMLCRCYTGDKRTRMRVMKFSWRDAVAALAVVAVCGGAIALNIIFPHLI